MMTEERQMVAMAVLNGDLGAEYLTEKEVDEIQQRVMDLVMEKELLNAQARGKSVFLGLSGDPLQ